MLRGEYIKTYLYCHYKNRLMSIHKAALIWNRITESERTAIRTAIESRTKFRVCGEASNGVEAIRQANELRPDLVLMDLAMPHMNGLEAAKVLRNTMPTVPVVLLTLHADLIGPRSSVLGVTLVLSKDDGLAPLLRCLERMLGRKS